MDDATEITLLEARVMDTARRWQIAPPRGLELNARAMPFSFWRGDEKLGAGVMALEHPLAMYIRAAARALLDERYDWTIVEADDDEPAIRVSLSQA